MNSKYPYLDPDWIKIMKEWVQLPSYDQNQSSELLARNIAYTSGKLDFIGKLEVIVRLQEKDNNNG